MSTKVSLSEKITNEVIYSSLSSEEQRTVDLSKIYQSVVTNNTCTPNEIHKKMKNLMTNISLHFDPYFPITIQTQMMKNVLKTCGPTISDLINNLLKYTSSYFQNIKKKLTLPYIISSHIENFQNDLNAFRKNTNEKEKLFFVQTPFYEGQCHTLLVLVRKKNNETPEIEIYDSLGSDLFFSINPNLLKSLFSIFPNAKVSLSEPKREYDLKSCWLFTIYDALSLCQLKTENRACFLEKKPMRFLLYFHHQLRSSLFTLWKLVTSWKDFQFYYNNFRIIGRSIWPLLYLGLFYRKNISIASLAPELMISTQSCKTLEEYQKSFPNENETGLKCLAQKKEKYCKELRGKLQNHFCTLRVASLFSRFLLEKQPVSL